MAGHNASQAKIHEQNALQNCHPRGNNQELVDSEQVEISQSPNLRTRKRNRGEDEEEDELALPTKYTRIRTSAMPGLENWEAVTLCQLAKRDPESVCDLLDGGKAEINRQRIKIESLEAEIKQDKKRIKTLNYEMEQLLLQNVEDFGTKKASDDTINSMWCQLSYKIKNTISNYSTEWPQHETSSINGIEYDRHVQSTSSDQIPGMRDSLKRRQLWSLLFCNIFAALDRCYLGNIGGPMARLIASLGMPKESTFTSCLLS